MDHIRLERDGALLRVSLNGRLSQEEGAQLAARAGDLLKGDDGARDLLLDLTEVEYMTSAAVGSMACLCQQVRLGGGRMAIAAPNERVYVLLEIAGLNQLLPVCRTAEDARRKLDQGGSSGEGSA